MIKHNPASKFVADCDFDIKIVNNNSHKSCESKNNKHALSQFPLTNCQKGNFILIKYKIN